MNIYLAPMEGVTGYIVRNAIAHNFGRIHKYYTPFIPAAKRLNQKILRDLAPENNTGISLVPQLMTIQADEVQSMGQCLHQMGFDEININLGCPSGTVVAKGRGSGLLRNPDALNAFLSSTCDKVDFPVSIKSRIGFEDLSLWPEILSIYARYPICELTIHPRLRSDFYNGSVHFDAFDLAYETYVTNKTALPYPTSLIYNGDIRTLSDYQKLRQRYPDIQGVMIGRGLLHNPALAAQIMASEHHTTLSETEIKAGFKALHQEICTQYACIFSGDKDVLFHMNEILSYLHCSFKDSDKIWKTIRKSQTLAEYEYHVAALFEQPLTLNEIPL